MAAVAKPMCNRTVIAAQVRAYSGKARRVRRGGGERVRGRSLYRGDESRVHAAIHAAEVEVALRRLLPLKTKAEYEPDDVASSVAAKAVERAARCVAVARRVAFST